MNVLVVSSQLPSRVEPERAIFNWRQVRTLADMASLVAVAPVPWAPPLPTQAWRRVRAVPDHETLDGIEVLHPRYLVVPRHVRRLQGWSYTSALDRVLASLRGRFAPDVIFATWAYPDLYAATRVGRRHGLPVVGKVHGSDLNVLPGLGLREEIRTALSAVDRLVAVGESLRARAVALGAPPERTLVVRNGVDLERFAPRSRSAARAALGLPVEGDVLLYVGRLLPVKGPDVLIEALPAIAAARPTVHLSLVGDGPLEASLRRRAEALGVAARCRFAGQRAQAEVARWLNAASLLVVPSRAEGVPNVVLEALASGTPVVASRVGGVAEVLEEGAAGLLVPPEDPAALARAVAATLDLHLAPDKVRGSLRVRSWAESAGEILGALHEAIRVSRGSTPSTPSPPAWSPRHRRG